MGSDNSAPWEHFHTFLQDDKYTPFAQMRHNSALETFDQHCHKQFWELDDIPWCRRISSLALVEIFLQVRILSCFRHDNFAFQLELEPFRSTSRRLFLLYPRNNQMIPFEEWCSIWFHGSCDICIRVHNCFLHSLRQMYRILHHHC